MTQQYSDIQFTRRLLHVFSTVIDQGLANHRLFRSIVRVVPQFDIPKDVVDNQSILEGVAGRVRTRIESLVEAVEEVRVFGEVDRQVLVAHTEGSA